MYSLGTPDAALSDLIDRYWFVACPPGETFSLAVDVYVDAQADLVVNFGVPYRRVFSGAPEETISFSGVDAQRTRPLTIRQDGNVQVCGVRFHPGGLAAFTDVAMRPLTDRVLPLDHVFGQEANRLAASLSDLHPGHEAQARAMDAFFLGRLATPPAYREFREILQHVAAGVPDETSVSEIAGRAGRSVRTVERLFQRYLGLPPVLYLRVARFQYALRTMMDDPGCDLADVAHGAGYYDQSHLVREFHELAGGVPRRYRGYLPAEGRDFAPNVVRYDGPSHRKPDSNDRAGDNGDEQIEAQIDRD